MTDLIAMHRRVQAREFAEACRELKRVRAGLRERDLILWAVLNRVGPQTFTMAERAAIPDGAVVRCLSDPESGGVTFSAFRIVELDPKSEAAPVTPIVAEGEKP
jgi:hypothetical protein